jgi:hypothetical protein
MDNLQTYEEFLNEGYSRRFGNFQVAISKVNIELKWMDEMKDIPDGVKSLSKNFGRTPLKEIAVVFEKDINNFDELRQLVREFGVMALFGLDTKEGRFCVINTNS